MFITSTVNAKSASSSDLPVVVLAYGDQSYLVKVTEKYEDITDLAIKVFCLDCSPTSVVLETSTLDICRDRAVRIHKSAWESIRSLVAEVRVRISNEADDVGGQKTFQEPLAISSSKQPQAQVLDDQIHSQKEPSNIEKVKADADQDLADEDEAEQLAALSSFAGSVANSDYEDENHVSEEDIFAAENVEEEGLRDTSGRHNRSLTAGRALPNEMEEHNQADEDWVEYNEAFAHPVKAEPQNAEQLARALGGYATRDLQDVRNDVEPRADVYGADRLIKKETMPTRLTPEPHQDVVGSSQTQPQSQEDEEAAKFIIFIGHRSSEQVLPFKTRGEHTVGKVLTKACQIFQLNYDSATLKLVVEIEGEEESEILLDCDKNDTMARSGAANDAKFIIVTDDH